jgi:steroid delta-isomerase-like uncharacterized protein
MTTDNIRRFCSDYARSWEQNDVSALVAFYAEDCEVVSPIFNLIRGRAQLEKSFRELFRAFSDFKVEVDDIVVESEPQDRAVILFRSFLTHRGEIFGMPGTGRRFELRGAFVLTIENGRITRDSRLYDFTGMLMQLGVLRAKTA